MLATDQELRETLGRLCPCVARATSVAPSARWLKDARAASPPGERATERAVGAVRRTLAALLRADIVSRPDLLVGGVRLVNQRLVRGLLWLVSVVIEQPAELLGSVGLRMGTSAADRCPPLRLRHPFQEPPNACERRSLGSVCLGSVQR